MVSLETWILFCAYDKKELGLSTSQESRVYSLELSTGILLLLDKGTREEDLLVVVFVAFVTLCV